MAQIGASWSCMAFSITMPVRIALGWTIALLDFYQTPAIVTDGIFSEARGFFSELVRPAGSLPHDHVNPQTAEVSRPRQYADGGDVSSFPLATCS